MKRIAALLLIFTVSLANAEGPRPKIARPAVVSSVLIDGEKVGATWIFPSKEDDKFLVESEALLEILEGRIKAESLSKLENAIGNEKVVSKTTLKGFSIDVKFDERSLVSTVEIPVAERSREEFNFGRRKKISGKLYESAPFSGILNARGSVTASNAENRSTDKIEPFRGGLESVTKYRDFLLITGAEVDEKSQVPYRRLETRFVYDRPNENFRALLGDLEPQLAGFQTALAIGGVGASRNFSLSGLFNRNVTLVSRNEIMVAQPSEIEVLINGTSFTTLRVAPGPVSLSQLPLMSGLNDVVLLVRDSLGRVETIRLTYLLDLGILDQGLHEFSYQAGWAIKTRFENRWEERDYDQEHPRFSLFHRYGVTPTLTVGLNYQSSDEDFVGGLEFRKITRFGLFSFDQGVSQSENFDRTTGSASRLSYRSLDQVSGGALPLNFRAVLEHQSERFLPVDAVAATNPYGFRTEGQVLYQIRSDLNASLGQRYYFGRDVTDSRVTSLDLNWMPKPEWQIGITATNTVEERVDQTVFINLTYFDFTRGHSVVGRYSSPQDSTRLEFQKHPPSGLRAWQASAGLERTRASDLVDASALYRGTRADVGLQHRSYFARNDNTTSNRASTFNWGTALVFTDQAVAWSRPVQDSFVILPKRSKQLKNYDVGVNRFDDIPQAIADEFGPAVLTQVSSYSDTPVIFDTQSLPPGVKPQNEFNVARLGYRGGVTIPIATSGQVAVSAVMTDASGAVLSLSSGKIERVTGDFFSKYVGEFIGEFFTNSKGRVLIESIEPGDYWLTPYDRGGARVKLAVPDEAIGLLKINEPLKLEVAP